MTETALEAAVRDLGAVVRDSADQGTVALNIGCGDDRRDGWVNVDVRAECEPDLVVDVGRERWPLDDASAHHVEASHSFEHLDPRDGSLGHALDEAARVLIDHGTMTIRIPFGADLRSDGTHYRWDWSTFEALADGWQPWIVSDWPMQLVERDVDAVVQPPPGLLARLWYDVRFRFYLSRRPGRWVTSWPFATGEIVATYRRDRR